MANVAVVGAQWGDEGKGKIVDWLSNRADMVVRFQGGHNAGHTLVVDGKVYKLALLPSGVVQGKPSIIGNGVVVDPWHLVGEIEKIEAQGIRISPDVLIVADNACLILPIHPALDVAREAAASAPGARFSQSQAAMRPCTTSNCPKPAGPAMSSACERSTCKACCKARCTQGGEIAGSITNPDPPAFAELARPLRPPTNRHR